MRIERHQLGEKKYGSFTWMSNDTARMFMEEIADAMNYLEYTFMKVAMINDALAEQVQASGLVNEDTPEHINIGAQAFRGTKAGWSTGGMSSGSWSRSE